MRDRRGWVVPVVVAMFAVALGLVLGSGPLRTALIGSMGAQVESLEGQVAQAELAAARAEVNNDYGQEWVDVAAPQLLADTLSGAAVAIVAVDSADAAAVAGIHERLTQAGATVVASLSVEPLWVDSKQAAYRAALAPQLAPSVEGLDGSETVNEVFSQALVQALVSPDRAAAAPSGDEDVAGSGGDAAGTADSQPVISDEDRGQMLWTLLSDAGLVAGTRTAAANAVVLVAGEPTVGEDGPSASTEANLTLARALTGYDVALVAANGPDVEGDLVSMIVADTDTLASRVSTVTWIQTPFSQVTVVLALREQFDGWVGHYGPGEGRKTAPPAGS